MIRDSNRERSKAASLFTCKTKLLKTQQSTSCIKNQSLCAIHTGNIDCPLGRHHLELRNNSNPASLQAFGLGHIPSSIGKGDTQNKVGYKLQAHKHQGLNEETDFTVFLYAVFCNILVGEYLYPCFITFYIL